MTSKYDYTHLHSPGELQTGCGLNVDGTLAVSDNPAAVTCPACQAVVCDGPSGPVLAGEISENTESAAEPVENAFEDAPGSAISSASIPQAPPKPTADLPVAGSPNVVQRVSLDIPELSAINERLKIVLECLAELLNRTAAHAMPELPKEV